MSKSLENDPLPRILYILIKCENCNEPIPIKLDVLIPSCWYGYQCNCGHITNIKTHDPNKKELKHET